MHTEARRPGRPPVDDEPILRLLAASYSAYETAGKLGVSPTTVYARLRDPLFNARLHEYRAQELQEVQRDATGEIGKSIAALVSIRDNLMFDPKVRVAAAKTLIDSGVRLRAEVLILPRLAALEAALAEKGIELPMPVGRVTDETTETA